jgi:hypothetical protein
MKAQGDVLAIARGNPPMSTPTDTVSFANDIRPLFRPIDIDHMSWFCDLSKYEDVRANAQDILDRLNGTGGQRMPPPASGGPWTPDKIALFQRWIDTGCMA